MKIKVVATLDNQEINALTPFSISGIITGGAVAAGDCLIINRAQPYSAASINAYSGPPTDFFAAFPESEKANLNLLT
jgi:hypothetical protein